MFKSMLLAVAVIAAGTAVASARDYSRADAYQRLAASDGRITKDEWRIIHQLRAQEAYRGGQFRERAYGYRGYSRADAYQRRAASDGRITKDEWRIIRQLRAQEGY
jgi:hypothetical protein